MRQRQTQSEARLWSLLRGSSVAGLKFRRQHPIGRFIADFYCDSAHLVVEIDGGYHEEAQQREFDREREAHFLGRGLTILRFTVDEVLTDCPSVLRRIAQTATANTKPEATPK